VDLPQVQQEAVKFPSVKLDEENQFNVPINLENEQMAKAALLVESL